MHVDDVVEAIFQRLCIRQQHGEGDHSMSLTELRLALGVTEALLNEVLWLLKFPGDKRIVFPTPGRVALGPEWRGRCERQTAEEGKLTRSRVLRPRPAHRPEADGSPS